MRKRKKARYVILMVPVGGEPYPTIIEDDFKAWQKTIGGRFFETVQIGPDIYIVCADDYHGIEDQPNGCGLYGQYFFVKTGDDGATRSLTRAELDKCRRYWQARRHDAPSHPKESGGSWGVPVSGTPDYDAYMQAWRTEALDKIRLWESL